MAAHDTTRDVAQPLSGPMPPFVKQFLRLLVGSVRDLAPIILVIGVFQIAVLQQPIPDLPRILAGLALVIVGLALFIQGLDTALFPLGESMADAFARKGNLLALLLFAFGLGFGTTVAEPALIAVAGQAARIAAEGGAIGTEVAATEGYALQLRLTVAVSVGIALVIGVLRILLGWPLPLVIIGGYILVMALTLVAPDEIIGIAFDSGGVTTSTITVPLVTALGVGLATAIRGRNPVSDGFGLIALASLTPMIFVMLFGIVRLA